jgi:hypothetical protein
MPQNKFRRTFVIGCGCTAFIKVNGSIVSAPAFDSYDMRDVAQRPKDNGGCKLYYWEKITDLKFSHA